MLVKFISMLHVCTTFQLCTAMFSVKFHHIRGRRIFCLQSGSQMWEHPVGCPLQKRERNRLDFYPQLTINPYFFVFQNQTFILTVWKGIDHRSIERISCSKCVYKLLRRECIWMDEYTIGTHGIRSLFRPGTNEGSSSKQANSSKHMEQLIFQKNTHLSSDFWITNDI